MTTLRKGKWRVSVRVFRSAEILVDADSYTEAQALARQVSDEDVAGGTRTVSVGVNEEIEGPFVRGGWYDLHEVGDVVCFRGRYGHAFTAAEIQVLRTRLETTGLTVREHWNGEGCDRVSFRCSGRTDMNEDARLPESVYEDVKEE
jgi:hypothetical protein